MLEHPNHPDLPVDAAARHFYAAEVCRDAAEVFVPNSRRAEALLDAEAFFLKLGDRCLHEVIALPPREGDPGGSLYPTSG